MSLITVDEIREELKNFKLLDHPRPQDEELPPQRLVYKGILEKNDIDPIAEPILKNLHEGFKISIAKWLTLCAYSKVANRMPINDGMMYSCGLCLINFERYSEDHATSNCDECPIALVGYYACASDTPGEESAYDAAYHALLNPLEDQAPVEYQTGFIMDLAQQYGYIRFEDREAIVNLISELEEQRIKEH